MLAYLIKSILCLLVLWGFYKIALEQTAAHNLKRIYLLGSLVLALTLPLITFSYTVEVEPPKVVAETYFEPVTFTEAPVAAPVDEPTNWLLVGLGVVYLVGVLLFGFRFLRNLIRLRKKINSNEKVQAKSYINVLLTGKVVPHSFLKFIFLPKTEFKANSIAPEILAHERAHVTQKHTWDILAVEFLQVIFWFNPLLVLLKRSIALNHEFLADRAALAQNTTAENYTNLLFTYSGGAHHTALSSPINYSLTKKRILMLSKTQSVKKLATRLALFVPVLALCICFFNEEIVAKPIFINVDKQTDLSNTQTNSDSLALEYYNTSSKKGNPLLKKFITDSVDKNNISARKLDQDTSNILNYKVLKDQNLPPNQFKIEYEEALDSLTIKRIQDRFKSINFNGKKPTKAQIDSWIQDGFRLSIDREIVTQEDIINVDPSNFVNYYGSKTIDTVLGKIVNAHVTFMTNDYYENVNRSSNQKRYTSKEMEEYRKQRERILNITVTGSQVWVNGKETSIENFAKDLDALSKDWTFSDKRNYSIHVRTTDPAEKIWQKLQSAFETTALYKANPKGLIPPPPPPVPAAPNAGTPPPPPPAPASETKLSEEELIARLEQDGKVISFKIEEDQILLNSKKVNIEDFVKEMNAITRGWTQGELENCRVLIGKSTSNADPKLRAAVELEYKKTDLYQAQPAHGLIPPPPPPAPAAPKAGTPPPPPPPPSAQEMVDMAKDNIYYNDKKISPAKAKSLMKESDNYNILMTSFKGKKALIIKDKE